MDLWVVAAAAGAGYIAKYWQNLSSRENEGLSDSFPGCSIHGDSESQNFLQQIRDRTCPLRRLAQSGKKQLSQEDRLDGRLSDINRYGGDKEGGIASTSGNDGESFQGFGDGVGGKSEFSDNVGDLVSDFMMGENGSFGRLARSRDLRSRSYGYFVNPVNSSESCLTAQLYKDHARMEEYVYSSVASVPSPCATMVRPLLVTDGSRIISRANLDLKGEMQFESGENKIHRGGELEENEKLMEPSTLSKIGSFELPKKLKRNCGRRQNRRLSSSSTRLSGGPFHSQGSPNGTLLFFLGITIGIMSAVIANKKEVDKLNELLRETEKLAQDLHEELEMKDLLTVKELTDEDSDEGFEPPGTNEHSFLNGIPTAISNEQELDNSAKYNGKELDDQKAEDSEEMSKIEAELEAELQRLELNMKTSSLERISDFVELDPDFEADLVQGDLRVDKVNAQPGYLSDSDHDATGTSTNHTHLAENFAVSPRELRLRLHEVIQSRLEARIMELEAELENSQQRLHSMESKSVFPQKDFYSEVESSSAQESPTFIDEGNDINQPLVINLAGKALDAYSKAYREITRMSKTDEETLREKIYNSDHIEKEIHPYDRRLFQDQNDGDNRSSSLSAINEERWSKNLVPDKTRTWEEQTSRSCGSNEIGESEDEDDDDDDDDEIGKLLIKQIVEKTRQGSTLVLNAKRMLYSMDN